MTRDLENISLKGIDIGVLMAGLYNNGLGVSDLHPEIMSPDEAGYLFNAIKKRWVLAVRDECRPNQRQCLHDTFKIMAQSHDVMGIQWISGRSIYTNIGWDENGDYVLKFSRFWHHNDIPVAAVIELARKGISGQIRQKDYAAVRDIVCALLKVRTPIVEARNSIEFSIERFEAALVKLEERYNAVQGEVLPQRPKQDFYYIKYGWNGVLSRVTNAPVGQPDLIPMYDPTKHVVKPVTGFPSFARK